MPTGWTSYLHWQGMLDALRGRRAAELGASAAAELRLDSAAGAAAQPGPEPRAALPDRRSHAASEAPAVDGWLERTPD